MKINNPLLGGKIYFFKSDKSQNPKDCFTPLLEVNSNFDNLKSLYLGNGKAYGITVNNELLEWEFDKKQKSKNNSSEKPTENSVDNSSPIPTGKSLQKKNDYYFLISKPSYRFHKMKIKQIRINKTMCLSLDISGNVYVWGENKEGLLGLGYGVTNVETPTILEGLSDINDISLSDYHAVALNSSGTPFSWGLGKYGELGLEKTIYSPFPQQMNTEGLYSRVFCGNLITCFLDFNGHFSYFGVIIRQLGGNNSTITVKNLLNDQNIDTQSIFAEKEIEELEDQKFKDIIIGNGFISLLAHTGTLFTLEYNDKLTMLYSKYYLYNIVVAKNEIFGLAKDNVKISENQNSLNKNNNVKNSNNKNNNDINLNDEEKIKTNYYLCRWSSKSSSENEVCSDVWSTTIWKFKDEFIPTIENSKLLDSNENRNILLLLDCDEKFVTNLNTSVLNPNRKFLDASNNEISLLDSSLNNNTTFLDNLLLNYNKKKFPDKILEFEAEFDDSFNLKYKRTKAKRKPMAKDTSYLANIRSRSLSPFLNKSYNASFQNSVINLNKSNIGNIGNIGNNNISAIGLNSSGIGNRKFQLIPNNNNYKKNSSNKILGNINNSNNKNNGLRNAQNNKNNGNNMNNFLFSKNSHDLIKDNNDIDNNNQNNVSGNNLNDNNTNKNEGGEGENLQPTLEESIDAKERELNKYRSEIDNIINNYKNRRVLEKNNLMNKYGISKENSVNISKSNNMLNKNINNNNIFNSNSTSGNKKSLFLKTDSYNDPNFDSITPINTNNSLKGEEITNSEINNFAISSNNNRYNNGKNKESNRNVVKEFDIDNSKKNKEKILRQKINEINREIMSNLLSYFHNGNKNLMNKNKKRRNNRIIAKENEINYNVNRQETFQDIYNSNNDYNDDNENKDEYHSAILSSPHNLLLPNYNFTHRKYHSEGNNSFIDTHDYFVNKNHSQSNNKFNNNSNYNNDLISSPAFNKGEGQKSRMNEMIKNKKNKNNNEHNKNSEEENNDNNYIFKETKCFSKKNDNEIDGNNDNNNKTNKKKQISKKNKKKGGNNQNMIDSNNQQEKFKINNIGLQFSFGIKKAQKQLNNNNNKEGDFGIEDFGAECNEKDFEGDKNNKYNNNIKNKEKKIINQEEIDKERDNNYMNLPMKFDDFEKNQKNKKIYSLQKNDDLILEGEAQENNDETKISYNGITKSSISYFIYLMTHPLRKFCLSLCVHEIANFQKAYERKLSLKLLFMILKKRIIFYKIKFFHRFKKIHKYLIKYKKSNNTNNSNYFQKKINKKGFKK